MEESRPSRAQAYYSTYVLNVREAVIEIISIISDDALNKLGVQKKTVNEPRSAALRGHPKGVMCYANVGRSPRSTDSWH